MSKALALWEHHQYNSFEHTLPHRNNAAVYSMEGDVKSGGSSLRSPEVTVHSLATGDVDGASFTRRKTLIGCSGVNVCDLGYI